MCSASTHGSCYRKQKQGRPSRKRSRLSLAVAGENRLSFGSTKGQNFIIEGSRNSWERTALKCRVHTTREKRWSWRDSTKRWGLGCGSISALTTLRRYLDILPALLTRYNHSNHRSIGMTPHDASQKENETQGMSSCKASLPSGRDLNSPSVIKWESSRSSVILRKATLPTGWKRSLWLIRYYPLIQWPTGFEISLMNPSLAASMSNNCRKLPRPSSASRECFCCCCCCCLFILSRKPNRHSVYSKGAYNRRKKKTTTVIK